MFDLTFPKIGPIFLSTLVNEELELQDSLYSEGSKAQTSISDKSTVIEVLLVLCHSQKAAQVFLSETWDTHQ